MPGSIPKDKYINVNTIEQNINDCVDMFLDELQIERDYKSITSIKHSTFSYMMSYIYEHLFKPSETLCNNQKSYIDYNNTEQLQVLADVYIKLCQRFNKSQGLMTFSYLLGCSHETLRQWVVNGESNPKRLAILKYIQESHKQQQVNLLNDTPVGALAVANNDSETGLEWGKQQAAQIAQNAVYILPSERVERLKLDKPEE